MSAPTPRGRGGSSNRGFRGAANAASNRGNMRGRGAGGGVRGGSFRGSRGGSSTTTAATTTPNASNAHGLLQQMRTGAVNRGVNAGNSAGSRGRGTTRATSSHTGRGRGSGFLSKSFNTANHDDSPSNSRPSSPFAAGDSSDGGNVQHRYNELKNLREEERREAIRMGFLADPEKKTTLDKAITPVGTCTVMCPPFERVERIVQMMVDRCEKVADPSGGKPVASEEIMVKRFRRSAAGDDEQVPSDIRTPETLRKTLDYLVDKLIGGTERLAVVHKFVWDRTRAIRNDFSIQQVSKEEDVCIAVDCFERIARFHIIALHQLSNPENLHEGENFDVFQEREQLNNTLLSLMYYYDDHRDQIIFPHEAEFRAYHIILAFQSQHPDIEDRVQSWPLTLLADSKVQTALRLYQTAGNTLFDQGPLRPMTPFPVAQNDSGRFWTLMASGAVSYTLACVVELYFSQVRFGALDSLWRSCKAAPSAQRAKLRDWTIGVMTEHLGFDEEDEAAEFCAHFGLSFKTDDQHVTYLDLAAISDNCLDQSLIPKGIVFSHTFVEDKRCRRTLMAVINNVKPADAIRQGLIEEGDGDNHNEVEDDGQGLFIPESKPAPRSFGQGAFDPEASAFKPSGTFGSNALPANSIFGQQPAGSLPPNQTGASATFSGFGTQTGAAASQQPGFGLGDQAAKPRETTPPLSTKFGESLATANAGTSQPNGMASGQNPAWTTATGEQQLQQPRWMTSFGQNRASVDQNNPFGPKPPVQFGQPESVPSQAQPLFGGSTQAESSTSFSFKSFGTPAPKPDDVSPVSPFSFPKPSTSESSQAQSPFAGFQFAKTAPPAAVTTSSTSQAAAPFFAPTPPNNSQQGLPTFSFAPQPTGPTQSTTSSEPPQTSQPPSFSYPKNIDFQFPKAESDNKPAPLFQPSTESNTQKPFFSFTTQTQPTADSASSTNHIDVSQQAANTAASPSQPLFNFPTAQHTSEQPKPPAQTPLFNFQSATVSEPKPEDATPTQPTFDFTSAALNPSHAPVASTQIESTTPPHSPGQPKPQPPPVNKSDIIEHAARLALTQPHGLIQEFLEWCLPAVLQRVQREYEEELRQEAIDRLKQSYLYRKYGAIWRSIAWRNNLNKKASKRRHLLSETLKMEARMKQRQEDELKDIMSAVEETRRLKDEALQRKVEEAKVNSSKKMEPARLAGNKRKSLGETRNGISPVVNSAKSGQYQHKRSRTIGSMLPPAFPLTKAAAPTSSPGQFRHSIFSGRASLGRSTSSTNRRKSDIRPKQDQTKSTYFDLLALGVDPDTPVVPYTARQVEAKNRREQEARDAATARAYNRRRVGVPSTQPQRSPPQVASTASAATPPSPAISATSPQPSLTGSAFGTEAEVLLRQLRAARQELADQSKWFHDHSERLRQEVEQEEKFRSSGGSSHSSPVAVQNGHSHRNFSPASSVSRVDHILQRQGARSLANYKPMKGSDDLPVPMSKRSAERYAQQQKEDLVAEKEIEIETNGTAKKRRKRGVVDRSYRPGQDELEDEEEDLTFSPQKRTKKHALPARVARAQVPVMHHAQYLQQPAVQNKFASLQDMLQQQGQRNEVDLTSNDDDEQDDLVKEEGQEDETGGYGHYFASQVDIDAGLLAHAGGGSSSDEDVEELSGHYDDDHDGGGAGYEYVAVARKRHHAMQHQHPDGGGDGLFVDQAGDVSEEYDYDDDDDGDDEEQVYDEDEDEDEEGGEYEDLEPDIPTPNTRATSATGGTTGGSTSRATSSGPGATADDAIALSDSD